MINYLYNRHKPWVQQNQFGTSLKNRSSLFRVYLNSKQALWVKLWHFKGIPQNRGWCIQDIVELSKMTKWHSDMFGTPRVTKYYKLVLLKRFVHEKRPWNNVRVMLNLCLTVYLSFGCDWVPSLRYLSKMISVNIICAYLSVSASFSFLKADFSRYTVCITNLLIPIFVFIIMNV